MGKKNKQHRRRNKGTKTVQQVQALEQFLIDCGVSPNVLNIEEVVDPALPFMVNKRHLEDRITAINQDIAEASQELCTFLESVTLRKAVVGLFIPAVFMYSAFAFYFSCLGF
jgi:hypothetical protein